MTICNYGPLFIAVSISITPTVMFIAACGDESRCICSLCRLCALAAPAGLCVGAGYVDVRRVFAAASFYCMQVPHTMSSCGAHSACNVLSTAGTVLCCAHSANHSSHWLPTAVDVVAWLAWVSAATHMCIQLLDAYIVVQAIEGCESVVVQPQHLQVCESLKASQLHNAFAAQIQLCTFWGHAYNIHTYGVRRYLIVWLHCVSEPYHALSLGSCTNCCSRVQQLIPRCPYAVHPTFHVLGGFTVPNYFFERLSHHQSLLQLCHFTIELEPVGASAGSSSGASCYLAWCLKSVGLI